MRKWHPFYIIINNFSMFFFFAHLPDNFLHYTHTRFALPLLRLFCQFFLVVEDLLLRFIVSASHLAELKLMPKLK